MTGRLTKLVLLVAVLALAIAAFSAQAPEVMKERAKQRLEAQPQPRRGAPIESRFNLPRADGRRADREIRASSRAVSVLDDTRRKERVALTASAAASPGIAVCAAGTSYDFQHNDLGEKQIATIGGNPNTAYVHFDWTHWDVIPESIDRVDRFVNYNGWNPAAGELCAGDCGVTLSGAGADPDKARGGFCNLDVTSFDNAACFFHQRNEANQDPESGQVYGTWVSQQGIPCFDLFDAKELAGSVTNEIIWPHGRVDRNGTEATDVWHVVSHPTGDQGLGNENIYWRKVGVGGTWEGPVALDEGSGALNFYVAVDPAGNKVAVIYNQDHLEPNNLLQVVYMESDLNGSDWIADGESIYPDLLTNNGYSYIPVSTYSDPNGAQAWNECGGEYDFDGKLHVYWVEQAFTNVAGDARLKHWVDLGSRAPVTSTVAQAIGWNNQGGDGARDILLAFPGIGFGDGTTTCSDGPENPPASGQHTNYGYVYYLWEQYGGESAVEQADNSADNQMNLEVYIAASNDHGMTWSPPVNLTNTRTPGCDGTPGNECASERDPFIAYTVNNAIHIIYILDIAAGDAVFSNGPWTFNPVMYLKIDGGGGVDPDIICPEIAPSFSANITNADPDCEFHATYSPPGAVNENLVIENFGNAEMTGTITGFTSDWLTVAGGPYSVVAGGSESRAVSMNAGAGSIVSGGEGLYQDSISITHNDPTRPTPRWLPVDFFVFNDFACPDYQTLHTGGNGKSGVPNGGTLWLEVSNVERIANQDDETGGLVRLNGDSSWAIYDGSLIIGVPPNPDTLVYRNLFGTGNGQPGFRALSALQTNTTAYGTNTGEATAFANQTTVDSLIGIDVEYVFPQNSDSSEFVLLKYRIFNRTDSTLTGIDIGEAVDFDIQPRPDSLDDLQSGLQNTGHLVEGYNLVYQQGSDSVNHSIVGDVTATRFKAGMTAIMCNAAPRAWIAPNDPWIFGRPGGGFNEGYLYDEMTETGFEMFPPNDPDPEEDLHSVMVFEQNVTLEPTTEKRYILGLVSSNTGNEDDESDLLATTAKAWKYCFGWQEFGDIEAVAKGAQQDLCAEYAVDQSNQAYKFPFVANGTHETGLDSNCCGCVFEEVLDEKNAFVLTVNEDGCTGEIEFTGGTPCGNPYLVTYALSDSCGDYLDVCEISVTVSGPCECDCPWQSDWDEDTFITALDLGSLIDILFAGDDPVQDPLCPTVRGDFDCDTFPTALDLGNLIDYLFASGPGPCLPCDVLK
jgi:hypothetical protein